MKFKVGDIIISPYPSNYGTGDEIIFEIVGISSSSKRYFIKELDSNYNYISETVTWGGVEKIDGAWRLSSDGKLKQLINRL
jgi:hypothetical protein